jgi:hypothetical protein
MLGPPVASRFVPVPVFRAFSSSKFNPIRSGWVVKQSHSVTPGANRTSSNADPFLRHVLRVGGFRSHIYPEGLSVCPFYSYFFPIWDCLPAHRAAARQSAHQPEPVTHSRVPTPLNSDDEDEYMSEDQKKHFVRAMKLATRPLEKSSYPMDTRRSAQGRAGGQATATRGGSTDTCATRSRPSNSTPT